MYHSLYIYNKFLIKNINIIRYFKKQKKQALYLKNKLSHCILSKVYFFFIKKQVIQYACLFLTSSKKFYSL